MSLSCVICLNTIDCKQSAAYKLIVPRRSNVKLLTCNHAFHSDCLKRWWYIGSNWAHCPCCRDPIRFKRLSYSYNHLLISRKIKTTMDDVFEPFESELQTKYIYYDTPLLLLFTDTVRSVLHYAYWTVFGSLRKVWGKDMP